MRHLRLLALLAMSVPAPALADVPPPPGYVEACTAARQSSPAKECRECQTYHANPPGYCAEQIGPGFTLTCRSRGASAWTEVWCRPTGVDETAETTMAAEPAPESASPPPATTPERQRGCAAGSEGSALPALLLALSFALMRSRREKR